MIEGMQEMPPMPGNFQASNPMSDHAGSIIQLTNPNDELRELKLSLQNMEEDADGKLHVLGDPLMNEKGISSVIGQVRSAVNRVTIMSNLAKDDIPMLMAHFSDPLIKDLMQNRIPYAIRTPTDRTKILGMSQLLVYTCLRRGFEGDDKRFWKGSQQDIRTTVVNGGSGKGILSKFNPWSK